MDDREKRIKLLELLAVSAEDGEVSTTEEEGSFYTEKEKEIINLIGGSTQLDGNFTFDELLEASVKRRKKINTVLPNIQKTAEKILKTPDQNKNSQIKKCLESICARVKFLIPVLVTDDNISAVVEQQTSLLQQTSSLHSDMLKLLSDAKKSNDDAEKAAEKAKEANQKAQKANQKAQKANKEAVKATENTLSTVLTVLGLFVAIIIAVVAVYLNDIADIKSLSESIASNISTGKVILFSSLRWHITFLLIFFLIFLIAKLTGRSLAGMCKEAERADKSEESRKADKSCDCSVCLKDCRKVKQIWKRFLWFILMNIAFFAVEFSALYVEIRGW